MRAADIGDQTVVRLTHPDEFRYVVRMVRAHLHDGYLGVPGHREQGQRHADVVVEIAFGRAYAVFPGEHRSDQVLGGSLAVGSGQTYHRQTPSAQVRAMPYRQLLQCCERIIHHYQPVILRQLLPVGHSPCGAFLQGCGRIVVAVEILAFEREEYLSPGDFPTVGCHPASAVLIY